MELFDIGQSNSEHCRHWFFNGVLEIDGEVQTRSLMDMVRATLASAQANQHRPEGAGSDNSILAFEDNSSGIRGKRVPLMFPHEGSKFGMKERTRHIILTAETHNFPTGVAPFPGAQTGVGGRLRDIQATGRGAVTAGGVAGYCVGNLCLPGRRQVRKWTSKRVGPLIHSFIRKARFTQPANLQTSTPSPAAVGGRA